MDYIEYMKPHSLSELVRTIAEMRKPAIIAVSGYGGSGKTSLAHALQERLDSAGVISMDDFIIKDKMLHGSWTKAFDRQRLKAHVL